MRIAYGKLGRSIPLTMEDASSVGGDIEVIRLLEYLRVNHEVHLVGRNRANVELDGVVNHWAKGGIFDEMPVPTRNHDDPEYLAFIAFLEERTRRLPQFDAWVLWLGQHGSSLHCVPAVQKKMKGQITSPLISLINYGYPLVHMINAQHARPIWLCPDPRNQFKFRDLWDPKQREVLAQYTTTSGYPGSPSCTFYDERDGKLRKGTVKYKYSGIEMLAVPFAPTLDYAKVPTLPFGILVNEGPKSGPLARVKLVESWLGGLPDWEMFGHWTPGSLTHLGMGGVYPIDVTDVTLVLQRWRSTITFPASNSGWATAKPWECFSAGTICFKHPKYDSQGHIYSKDRMPADLFKFLTPAGPSQLRDRVEALKEDDLWRHYAKLQWNYLMESRLRLKDGNAAIESAITKAAGEVCDCMDCSIAGEPTH